MLRGNREFLSQYLGWLWVIGPYKKAPMEIALLKLFMKRQIFYLSPGVKAFPPFDY